MKIGDFSYPTSATFCSHPVPCWWTQLLRVCFGWSIRQRVSLVNYLQSNGASSSKAFDQSPFYWHSLLITGALGINPVLMEILNNLSSLLECHSWEGWQWLTGFAQWKLLKWNCMTCENSLARAIFCDDLPTSWIINDLSLCLFDHGPVKELLEPPQCLLGGLPQRPYLRCPPDDLTLISSWLPHTAIKFLILAEPCFVSLLVVLSRGFLVIKSG